jgi:cytochrome P450
VAAAVDLSSPDSYVTAAPHEYFEHLRRTEPVHFQPMANEPGFWAVLTHADVVQVSRHPEVFSAGLGGVVAENLGQQQLEMMRDMLLAMDPPRHMAYRRPLASSFLAKVMAGLEPRIREICRSILARAREAGEVEFVHDVTSGLPTQVIGELMGLPRADWDHIHDLAEMNTSGQDDDVAAEGVERGNASMQMAMYAMQFAAARREISEQPADLTTLLLSAEFDGKLMTDVDFARFFIQLVTAGNDTTKTMLASGLLSLLQNPDELRDVRADQSLIPGAVEEILRWANPLHYFRRTATADTVLHDVPIAAGDKVVMMYTSANRDEAVFDNPHRFDVRRSPNPHLAFGIGEHHCLGVHLARLEGRVFFEELLSTFGSIELTGEPRRVRSNLNNGLKSLPIRLAV